MMSYDDVRSLHEEFMTNSGRNVFIEGEVIPRPYQHQPSDTTSFGALTAQYPIMRHFLQYLPCRDLVQASKTCRDWMYSAEMELARRSRFGGSAWAGFVAVNPMGAFNLFADSVYAPASFCFWFSTEERSHFHVRGKKRSARLYKKVKDFLAVMHAPILTIVSDLGVVGCTSNMSVIEEGPLHLNAMPCFATMVTIPKMQGLQVHKFRFKLYHARQIMTINHLEHPDWLFEKINGPDKPIRCIIFFINEGLGIEPGRMFRALQHRQEERLVIGGAFVPTYEEAPSGKRSFSVVGVAFYGDNVQASSLALTLADKTPEDVDRRMEEFANGTLKGKVNLALMFTCCSRGLVPGNSSPRTYFDSRSFGQHFPGTPIHGVIGLGEIGCDWFPLENGIAKTNIADSEWTHTPVHQTYSSVFLHLAFGLEGYEDQLEPAHAVAKRAMAARLGTQSDSDEGDLDETPPDSVPTTAGDSHSARNSGKQTGVAKKYDDAGPSRKSRR